VSGDVHLDYRSEERSLLFHWLREPVFMPMVRALPRRLTPNQLTLLGHLCVWFTAGGALAASSHGTLLLLALAFGYTAYNLADTLDGLYARHSGRTSRLGELLDHGLDPLTLGIVLLSYGIVMDLPPWLVLASTGTIASMQFVTFLHGYRLGSVVLGEIGVIEGLVVAAVACLAAAIGGLPLLTQPLLWGVSAAGLLAVGVMAGALPALYSMRGLARHARDTIPVAALVGLTVAWFAFGALGVTTAGLLIVVTTVYESMLVTSARLLRLPLRLWDWLFVLMVALAATASIAADVDAGVQHLLASLVIGYAALRAGWLFFRTVSGVR
jgi:phosphatidylglycerophosphate synthase